MPELHFCDGGPLTAQYLLVVDSLNFCFWPDAELQYEHLAGGVKCLQGPRCISAARLAEIDGPGVQQLLGWHRELPEQDERARLLREVGAGLLQHFQGQAAELVTAAGQSAVALVQLLTAHFPGFRDHSIYKGRQVFFYKRAQIFVGDVYGAFAGKGLGCFHDVDQLTMFADYRVPVVLRLMGLLQYSPELQQQVEGMQELASGSEAEIELRAASIVAVELLKDAANAQLLQPPQLLSIQLDWWLWHEGERMRAQHPPHHRTMTIYY
ncbi:hypothetical protein COO60DRAFT_1270304 [Scenedesmus sp. NREL 46B-D3]|nr:hypothetical protein COO60DRAFT_1270304 [Scenedesmus sp. NREL 46B-D3]